MSDCCLVENDIKKHPKKHVCPENNNRYLEVPFETMLHHISNPWELVNIDQTYYFCDDPDCDVVYFGNDNSVFKKHQLRTKVGIKETDTNALICNCFGVSKLQAVSNAEAKAFVVEKTKNQACACSTHNPSGRCCLKDFPK